MFKRITGFFVKKKGNTEKRKLSAIENLILIVILGVIIILAGSYLASSSDTEDTMNEASSLSSSDKRTMQSDYSIDGHDVVADIERRLAELLSKVEGAGQVSVMVYADTGSEQVPAYNNIQDTRNDERVDGKSLEISETKQLALAGTDEPVILKVIIPQIKGVVVVAEGADDILIKAQLNNAVCTLLGIPEHRVQILKHK
jgi:stage III sporulation protein AG